MGGFAKHGFGPYCLFRTTRYLEDSSKGFGFMVLPKAGAPGLDIFNCSYYKLQQAKPKQHTRYQGLIDTEKQIKRGLRSAYEQSGPKHNRNFHSRNLWKIMIEIFVLQSSRDRQYET